MEKVYRVFYEPAKGSYQIALIPAASVKQALTRFNAAGFNGTVRCVQDGSFDSSLFNF